MLAPWHLIHACSSNALCPSALAHVLPREASISVVTLFVKHVADLTPHLAYLFPVLMARGVPAGSRYDPDLELFVHDSNDHDAYKRCVT